MLDGLFQPLHLVVIGVPLVLVWAFGFVSGIAYAKREKNVRS